VIFLTFKFCGFSLFFPDFSWRPSLDPNIGPYPNPGLSIIQKNFLFVFVGNSIFICIKVLNVADIIAKAPGLNKQARIRPYPDPQY
jgi:hypothetical protein